MSYGRTERRGASSRGGPGARGGCRPDESGKNVVGKSHHINSLLDWHSGRPNRRFASETPVLRTAQCTLAYDHKPAAENGNVLIPCLPRIWRVARCCGADNCRPLTGPIARGVSVGRSNQGIRSPHRGSSFVYFRDEQLGTRVGLYFQFYTRVNLTHLLLAGWQPIAGGGGRPRCPRRRMQRETVAALVLSRRFRGRNREPGPSLSARVRRRRGGCTLRGGKRDGGGGDGALGGDSLPFV